MRARERRWGIEREEKEERRKEKGESSEEKGEGRRESGEREQVREMAAKGGYREHG